jgi:hypothetical protein
MSSEEIIVSNEVSLFLSRAQRCVSYLLNDRVRMTGRNRRTCRGATFFEKSNAVKIAGRKNLIWTTVLQAEVFTKMKAGNAQK